MGTLAVCYGISNLIDTEELALAEGAGTEVAAVFAITKVAALAMKKQLSAMKKQFDASEYGGAPLLGISKPVIKAHGGSDAKAVKNAVLQTIAFLSTGINHEIARMAAELDLKQREKKKLNIEKNKKIKQPCI